MTTHLEYYSSRQRTAQTQHVRQMHLEALSQALCPPQQAQDGSPFQSKPHTPHAVLCGDFNFEVHSAEYEHLGSPVTAAECLEAEWPECMAGACWSDVWTLLHPGALRPPTFKVFDRQFGPEPVACDFVWVSDSLRSQVHSLEVDVKTQASDHQPVRVVIGV